MPGGLPAGRVEQPHVWWQLQLARDPERWKEEYEVEIRNRRRVELIRRIMGPDLPPGLDDLDELEEDPDE